MTLSRPFQILVVALALFVLVWFVALHRPGSSSSSSSASPSAPASTHVVVSHTAVHGGGSSASASHTTVHATSVNGRARVSTGHATVSTGHATASTGHATVSTGHATASTGHATASTGHAAHATTDGTQSAERSGASAHTHSSGSSGNRHVQTPTASGSASAGASQRAAATPHGTQPAQRGPAAAATSPHAPALQATVAAELAQGKVVLLLFWNPHSSDDSAVHRQVQVVAHKLGKRIVLHTASAGQVGAFGSITRDIQIYQTPTLLIVNPQKQVTTVTGYTDAYAIEQTIREARG